MVDLGNGLITQLIDVGTTSITFSVEWTPKVEIDHRWLSLMGKPDIEERGWHFLIELDVDYTQSQGKVTYEVLYDEIFWTPPEYAEVFKGFEKKGFFAVRIPVPPDTFFGVARGKYEEDDEMDVMEGWWLNDTPTATTTEAQDAEQSGVQTSPSATTPADRQAQQTSPHHLGGLETDEELGVEEPQETNSLWLFAGIIFCLYAICHFLRKRSPKNQKMKP